MLLALRRPRAEEVVPAAALVVLALAVGGVRPLTAGLVWLAVVTPPLVRVDLAEHRLPDAVVLPGYPVVLAAVVLDRWVDGQDAIPPLLAGAAYGLVLLLLHTTGGMGLGDVKLAPPLGALTAAAAPAGLPVALLATFLVGGVAATAVLLRRGAGARLPFGPPMLLGAWASLALLG